MPCPSRWGMWMNPACGHFYRRPGAPSPTRQVPSPSNWAISLDWKSGFDRSLASARTRSEPAHDEEDNRRQFVVTRSCRAAAKAVSHPETVDLRQPAATDDGEEQDQ